MISKIKKERQTGVLFFAPVRKGQILWSIESESCNDLDPDQRKHLNLLNRAIRFVRSKQTSLVNVHEGFEHNSMKVSAQSRGFQEGFSDFYMKSNYVDEDDRNKPWYLKVDDNSDPFLK